MPYDDYYYRRNRWSHKILLHNGKVLRIAIPLDAAQRLGWKPGDLVRIELHAKPDGLSITKHSGYLADSPFKQPGE